MPTMTKLTRYMTVLHEFEVRGYDIEEVRSYVSKAIDAVMEGNIEVAKWSVREAESIKIELKEEVAAKLEAIPVTY